MPIYCAIAVAALFSGHTEAIYKCTTAKGVVYQDRPCREGSESDVQIVIPTGELAPRAALSTDDGAQGNDARVESRPTASKQGRAGDNSPTASKTTSGRGASEGTPASDDSAKRDNRQVVEKVVPMTPEQARKAEATAKYYTTDTSTSGVETPEHMTCESPTGEKRKFILTNGKLTSI